MWEVILGLLGTAVIGVIGWAVMLNADIAVLKKESQDQADELKTKLNADVAMTVLSSIDKRLERIERHVLNGTYRNINE